jgi:hypothetical protein
MAVKGSIDAMFMCACEDCQRATGTGHSTVAMARAEAVTVTGETRSYTRPAASGASFTRWFCPTCGTPLHGASSRAPAALLLPVGFFGADASWFAPNQLIFSRSHRGWDLIAAELPQYDTYRGVEPGTLTASGRTPRD